MSMYACVRACPGLPSLQVISITDSTARNAIGTFVRISSSGNNMDKKKSKGRKWYLLLKPTTPTVNRKINKSHLPPPNSELALVPEPALGTLVR